jgi:hypothetical protein
MSDQEQAPTYPLPGGAYTTFAPGTIGHDNDTGFCLYVLAKRRLGWGRMIQFIGQIWEAQQPDFYRRWIVRQAEEILGVRPTSKPYQYLHWEAYGNGEFSSSQISYDVGVDSSIHFQQWEVSGNAPAPVIEHSISLREGSNHIELTVTNRNEQQIVLMMSASEATAVGRQLLRFASIVSGEGEAEPPCSEELAQIARMKNIMKQCIILARFARDYPDVTDNGQMLVRILEDQVKE